MAPMRKGILLCCSADETVCTTSVHQLRTSMIVRRMRRYIGDPAAFAGLTLVYGVYVRPETVNPMVRLRSIESLFPFDD